MPDLVVKVVVDDSDAQKKLQNLYATSSNNLQKATREQIRAGIEIDRSRLSEARTTTEAAKQTNLLARAKETEARTTTQLNRSSVELSRVRLNDARAATEQAKASALAAKALADQEKAHAALIRAQKAGNSSFALPRTFAGFTTAGAVQAGLAVAGISGVQSIGQTSMQLLQETKDQYRDYVEQVSKTKAVFKEASASVIAFGEDSAKSLGTSKTKALDAAGSLGALFEQLELGPRKTAEMSIQMVKLAADLTSFHNIAGGLPETLEKIRAGLSGEMEPLRRLGIHLDDATLRQRAFNMGLVDSTNHTLPPQIKMLAAYEEILKQTKTAQGDFARTSKDAANSERILNAEIQNMQINIGQKLMPLWKEFLTTSLSIVQAIEALSKGLEEVKPSPGLSQLLQNIKDAAEATKTAANLKAFESTAEGKQIQRIDDRSFLGDVAKRGVTKLNLEEFQRLQRVMRQYGEGEVGDNWKQYSDAQIMAAVRRVRPRVQTAIDAETATQVPGRLRISDRAADEETRRIMERTERETATTPSYLLPKADPKEAAKKKKEAEQRAAALYQADVYRRLSATGENDAELAELMQYVYQWNQQRMGNAAQRILGGFGYIRRSGESLANQVYGNYGIRDQADATEAARKDAEYAGELRAAKNEQRLKALEKSYDDVISFLETEQTSLHDTIRDAIDSGDVTTARNALKSLSDNRARAAQFGFNRSLLRSGIDPSNPIAMGAYLEKGIPLAQQIRDSQRQLSPLEKEILQMERSQGIASELSRGTGGNSTKLSNFWGNKENYGFGTLAADQIGAAIEQGINSGNSKMAMKGLGESLARSFTSSMVNEAVSKPLQGLFRHLGDEIANGGRSAGAYIYQAVGALYGLMQVSRRKKKGGWLSVLGGVGGFLVGGPAGAFAGYNAGNALDNGDFGGAAVAIGTGVTSGAFNLANGPTFGTKDLGEVSRSRSVPLVQMNVGVIHDRADADRVANNITSTLYRQVNAT